MAKISKRERMTYFTFIACFGVIIFMISKGSNISTEVVTIVGSISLSLIALAGKYVHDETKRSSSESINNDKDSI